MFMSKLILEVWGIAKMVWSVDIEGIIYFWSKKCIMISYGKLMLDIRINLPYDVNMVNAY